jgi:hypothetical protein
MPSLRKLDIQRIDFRQTFCDRARVTLVLYRRRAFTTKMEASGGCGARSIKPLEGSRPRGGRGGLWILIGVEGRCRGVPELCGEASKTIALARERAEAQTCG